MVTRSESDASGSTQQTQRNGYEDMYDTSLEKETCDSCKNMRPMEMAFSACPTAAELLR